MRFLARGYDLLIDAGAAAAAAAIAFIALGVTADVALRTLAGGTIRWMLETSEYLLFAVAFLGAPWVLRQGAHTAVDVVVRALPEGGRRACGVAAGLVGLAASLALLWFGGLAALQSRANGTMIYKTVVFPEWWTLALVCFSGGLLAAEFVRHMVRAARGDPGVMPRRQAGI